MKKKELENESNELSYKDLEEVNGGRELRFNKIKHPIGAAPLDELSKQKDQGDSVGPYYETTK